MLCGDGRPVQCARKAGAKRMGWSGLSVSMRHRYTDRRKGGLRQCGEQREGGHLRLRTAPHTAVKGFSQGGEGSMAAE